MEPAGHYCEYYSVYTRVRTHAPHVQRENDSTGARNRNPSWSPGEIQMAEKTAEKVRLPRLGFGFGLGLLLCFGVPFRFLGSLGAWFCLPNPTRMLKCCKIRYVLTFTNLISEDSQESSGRGVGRVRCDALRQSAEGSTTESMGSSTVQYLKYLP